MINWDDVKENGWQTKEDGVFKILSIDGGGIRGIFPAKYLELVEKSTGKRIYEYFDLIAGTSTGGIISLALSIGLPAEEITSLYVDKGKEIFEPRRILGLFKTKGIFSRKYNNDNLTNLLQHKFDDLKIRDAKTMLCIPSLEHKKAMPKVYKTPHHKHFHIDAELEMWKVALATSAAPSYFPAAVTTGNDAKLDGGMWANNPTVIAIGEAIKLGYRLDQIKVLSLGTGHTLYSASDSIAMKSTIFGYKRKLIDIFMHGQTQGAHHTSTYLLNDNIKRIDFTCDRTIELDSTKNEDIGTLLHEAHESFTKTYQGIYDIKGMFFEQSEAINTFGTI